MLSTVLSKYINMASARHATGFLICLTSNTSHRFLDHDKSQHKNTTSPRLAKTTTIDVDLIYTVKPKFSAMHYDISLVLL